MHAVTSSLVFALGLASARVPPQSPAVEPAAAVPRADRLAALQKEYEDARKAYFVARQTAKTDEEQQKLVLPEASNWAPRFWELVHEDSRDAVALDALSWLIEKSPSPEDFDAAVQAIEKDHLRSPNLGGLCTTLGFMQRIGTKLLERIAAENPERRVQGQAVYAIASHRLQSIQTARSFRGRPESEQASFREWLGDARAAELASLDLEKAEAEAVRLLERVIKDYADLRGSRKTLGETASGDLHEIRDLAIGKPVPEIEGEDLDGVRFKLSDYRGKVVLLDFWGNW